VALPYDAFLSYRSKTDYSRARWIESFLEGFHRSVGKSRKSIRPLQICRDGSDFRMPTKRELEETGEGVWPIVRHELEKCEHLLVLCSPGAVKSRWVDTEVEWFLEKRPEKILLIVTEAADPALHPEECFPSRVLEKGIHTSTIWYDLRGHERAQRRPGVRDWEDEIVRLAADLLQWDAVNNGPLWGIYQREQLRLRRRLATWISAAAAVGLALAVAAGWYALESNRQAQHARANSIVAAAETSSDPLTAALMLTELRGDEPQGGVELARSVASQILPVSELRGPQAGISFMQFVQGTDQIGSVADDGTLFLWKRNGLADPNKPASSLRARPVGLAIRPGGEAMATATREHKAMVWSPINGRVWTYTVDGMLESIQYLVAERSFVVITEGGKAFLLDSNGGVDEALVGGPAIATLQSLSETELLIGARDGEIWERKGNSPVLIKQPGPPASIRSEFPFNGPRYARFSPDGAWYAIAFNNRILFRSTRDARRFHILDYKDSIDSIAFSADSMRIAAGGRRGTAIVWDTSNGKQLREFDSKLRFWLTQAGKPVGSGPDSYSVEQVGFAPWNHDELAVLTSDGVVRLWDARGGDPLELRGHAAGTLAWSPDAPFLATGADVGTVRVWPLNAPGEPKILRHPREVDEAVFLSDGRVVSRARDKIVREWGVDGGEAYELPHKVEANTLALDSTGTHVFVGFSNGSVRQADGRPLTWVRTFKPLDSALTKVAVAKERILAISGGTLAVQELDSAGARTILRDDGEEIVSAEFRPDGKEFVTANKTGKVMLWSRVSSSWISNALLAGDGVQVFETHYSPDGQQIVTCSENGLAFLFSVAPPRRSKRLDIPSEGKWLESCAFSPDGKWLLITSETGQAWISGSDGQNARLLRRRDQLAHVGSIVSVSFDSNGSRVLLAGGVDGEATVWDVRSLRLLSVLSGHRGAITEGAISPDGAQLMTASEDGSIRLWRNGWKSLVNYLRSETTATLNPEQRIVLLGESEKQGWKSYRLAERPYGRSGDSAGPFKYPY
jgi:WD40 repeat protein